MSLVLLVSCFAMFLSCLSSGRCMLYSWSFYLSDCSNLSWSVSVWTACLSVNLLFLSLRRACLVLHGRSGKMVVCMEIIHRACNAKVLSCLVLSCPLLSCLALSCLALSCLVLSCLVLPSLLFSSLLFSSLLSSLVLSCLVLSCPVTILCLSCLVVSRLAMVF